MAHRPTDLAQRDTHAPGERVDSQRRYLSLDRRRRKLERWRRLVSDIRKKLEQIESSGSEPGLMFCVGIATGNPALTALSIAGSILSDVPDGEAREALAPLGNALPRHAFAIDGEAIAPKSLEALESHLAQLHARTIAQLKSASDGAAPAVALYEGAARAELPTVLQALARLT
jgi:hypothetical protein